MKSASCNDALVGSAVSDVRSAISPGRFDRYAAVTGSLRQAVELYEWNIRLTGALHEELGMFEVVLRNALDRELSNYHKTVLSGDGDWFADIRMPWRSAKMVAQLHRARSQATAGGRNREVHGKVIAELTFGFWRYILAAQYQGALWAPALRHAFPHLASQKRIAVYGAIDRLQSLRNRVAHHEPVYALNVSARHDEMLRAAAWIDPAAAAWIGQTSRVAGLLAVRPAGIAAADIG
jgi:hypothetical protein